MDHDVTRIGPSEGHSDILLQKAYNMYQKKDRKHLDMTVVLPSGDKFQCHSLVLLAYSGYFRNMLVYTNNLKTMKIYSDKVTAKSFDILLRFMYTGSIVLSGSNLYELYLAAFELQISGAVDMLSDKIDNKASIQLLDIEAHQQTGQADCTPSTAQSEQNHMAFAAGDTPTEPVSFSWFGPTSPPPVHPSVPQQWTDPQTYTVKISPSKNYNGHAMPSTPQVPVKILTTSPFTMDTSHINIHVPLTTVTMATPTSSQAAMAHSMAMSNTSQIAMETPKPHHIAIHTPPIPNVTMKYTKSLPVAMATSETLQVTKVSMETDKPSIDKTPGISKGKDKSLQGYANSVSCLLCRKTVLMQDLSKHQNKCQNQIKQAQFERELFAGVASCLLCRKHFCDLQLHQKSCAGKYSNVSALGNRNSAIGNTKHELGNTNNGEALGENSENQFLTCEYCHLSFAATSKGRFYKHFFPCKRKRNNELPCSFCFRDIPTADHRKHVRQCKIGKDAAMRMSCDLCGNDVIRKHWVFHRAVCKGKVVSKVIREECRLCKAKVDLNRHTYQDCEQRRMQQAETRPCQNCGEMMRSSEKADHYRCRSMVKVICEICGKELSKAHMRNHMAMSHNQTEYICSVCDRRCEWQARLQHHMNDMHGEHVCEHCGMTFPNTRAFDVHVRKCVSNAEEEMIKCGICNETIRKSALMAHRRMFHQQTHKCLCGKEFDNRGRHCAEYNKKTYKYNCVCGKGYDNKFSVYTHRKKCAEHLANPTYMVNRQYKKTSAYRQKQRAKEAKDKK